MLASPYKEYGLLRFSFFLELHPSAYVLKYIKTFVFGEVLRCGALLVPSPYEEYVSVSRFPAPCISLKSETFFEIKIHTEYLRAQEHKIC